MRSALEEALTVTLRVVRVFESLGVRYLVGGSVASSIYGPPRATQDVDLVAELEAMHIPRFVSALRGAFYLDEDAIRDAVERRSSFNLIDLETMFKVDVFVADDDGPTTRELERRRPYVFPQVPDEPIQLASPEDTIVQKLHWYRLGDEVSERQWLDAVGVLKLRGPQLDLEYMRDLAEEMKVADLLDRLLSWDQPLF